MKTRLIAASLFVIGSVACSSNDAETTASSENEWIIAPKGGALFPASCELLPGAEMPASKTTVFAHGDSVTCGAVTVLNGQWRGASTFTAADPGFCTFDWVGTTAPDFQGLIGALPEGTIVDRAACGTTLNGGDSSLFGITIDGGTGITCGACTPAGLKRAGHAQVILPLSAVKLAAQQVTLMNIDGARRIKVDLPVRTQIISVPVVESPHQVPYVGTLYVSNGIIPPAL